MGTPAADAIERAGAPGVGPAAGPRRPAAITSAAPNVGRSAATPGNGVDVFEHDPGRDDGGDAQDADRGQKARRGSAIRRHAARARAAPSASSQARAGSVKNAHGWATLVSTSDRTSEIPNTIATTAASRPIVPRPRRATSRRSAGQNR